MEALWTRFNPTFKQLLSWLKEDMIGPIRYINASFSFNGLKRSIDSRLFNPHKAGGSLLDIGIYPLFLAYLVLGKPKDIKSNAIKLVVVLISKLVFYYHMRIHTLFYIQAFLIMKK